MIPSVLRISDMTREFLLNGYKIDLLNETYGSGLGAAYARFEASGESLTTKLPKSDPPESQHQTLIWGTNFSRFHITSTLHYGRITDIYESNSLGYKYDINFSRTDESAGLTSRIHWRPFLPWVDPEMRPETAFGCYSLGVDIQSCLVFVSPSTIAATLFNLEGHLRFLSATPRVLTIFALFAESESCGDASTVSELSATLSKILRRPIPFLEEETIPNLGNQATSVVRVSPHLIHPTPQGQLDLLLLLSTIIHICQQTQETRRSPSLCILI